MTPTADSTGPRDSPGEAFEPLGAVLADLQVNDLQLDARLRALEAKLLPGLEGDRRFEKIHERIRRTDETVSDVAVNSAKAQGRLRALQESQNIQTRMLDEILRRLPGEGGPGAPVDGSGAPGSPDGFADAALRAQVAG